MKNSKYIKVSVSDRLPEKNGWYDTDCGNIYFRITKQRTNWKTYEYGEGEFPEYWLEEVIDYEDEMKEMINELISELDPATLCGNYQEAIDKAKSLLTKLKTES